MFVLSNGLNFIPVSKQSDEFQVKKDAENSFCRARLKAFFNNSSGVNSDRDIFRFSVLILVNLTGFLQMDNSLLLTFSLTYVAMTSPMSILIANLVFLIFPKKNGQLSVTFTILILFSLSLLTKVVPSLFGAPTFTKRRLIVDYLILPFS